MKDVTSRDPGPALQGGFEPWIDFDFTRPGPKSIIPDRKYSLLTWCIFDLRRNLGKLICDYFVKYRNTDNPQYCYLFIAGRRFVLSVRFHLLCSMRSYHASNINLLSDIVMASQQNGCSSSKSHSSNDTGENGKVCEPKAGSSKAMHEEPTSPPAKMKKRGGVADALEKCKSLLLRNEAIPEAFKLDMSEFYLCS